MASTTQLRAGDRVRLLAPFLGIPAGATGRVVGFYRRAHDATCVVRFDHLPENTEHVPCDALETV